MRWASAVSSNSDIGEAVAECARSILQDLAGQPADLLVVFASAGYGPDQARLPDLVLSTMSPPQGGALIGCSAGGVIGGGHEIEAARGLAIAAASLPGVRISGFHIENDDLPIPDEGPEKWEELVGVKAAERPHFVIAADPFSIRAESLLAGLDFAYPTAVKVGGLASGAARPGGHALFLGDTAHGSGAVGVAMSGNIQIGTVVAQGCRPIGEPLVVTRGHGNVLLELGGRPALTVLGELVKSLSAEDRALVSHSLFIGIVMDPLTETPAQGDYLIRHIVGIDRDGGALGIAADLHEGQTVQFHLRNASTAAYDLEAALALHGAGRSLPDGSGALMFSCLGRGRHLYGRPDHDSDMVRGRFGAVPITGFFCNGEIGPVAGTSYLHGYTSALGIFTPGAAGAAG